MRRSFIILALLAGCSSGPAETKAQAVDAAKTAQTLAAVKKMIGPRYARGGGVYRGMGGLTFSVHWKPYCRASVDRKIEYRARSVTRMVHAASGMYEKSLGGGGGPCEDVSEKLSENRSLYDRYPNGQLFFFHILSDAAAFDREAAEMKRLGAGFITYVHPEERCLIRLMVSDKRRILSIRVVMRELSEGSFSPFEKLGAACVWRSLLVGNGLMHALDMSVDELNFDPREFGNRHYSSVRQVALYLSSDIAPGTPLDEAMKIMAARTDLKDFYPTGLPTPGAPEPPPDVYPPVTVAPAR